MHTSILVDFSGQQTLLQECRGKWNSSGRCRSVLPMKRKLNNRPTTASMGINRISSTLRPPANSRYTESCNERQQCIQWECDHLPHTTGKLFLKIHLPVCRPDRSIIERLFAFYSRIIFACMLLEAIIHFGFLLVDYILNRLLLYVYQVCTTNSLSNITTSRGL